VLVLGDSVTFGWLIDEPDYYVALLRARAAREWPGQIELLNASVGGWGTAEYAAFLEDQGETIPRPDAILVVLSGDETRRAYLSRLWTRSPNGGLERLPPGARYSTVRLVTRLPGYLYLIEHSHLAALVRSTIVSRIGQAAVPADERTIAQATSDGVALHRALISRLHDWSTRHGLPLWVVDTGLVNRGHSAQEKTLSAMNRQFTDQLAELLTTLRVPYLDLEPGLEGSYKAGTVYFIPGDYHPTEAGHRLVAELSWPWLKERLSPVVAVSGSGSRPGPR